MVMTLCIRVRIVARPCAQAQASGKQVRVRRRETYRKETRAKTNRTRLVVLDQSLNATLFILSQSSPKSTSSAS